MDQKDNRNSSQSGLEKDFQSSQEELFNKEELNNLGGVDETLGDVNGISGSDVSFKNTELDPLEKVSKEKSELQDKYLRLVAEFENYRKRSARERLDLIMTANREIMSSLLDVLDDIERASKQFGKEADIKNVVEGANLVFNKLRNVLFSKGLKKMEVLNSDFQIEAHEAITEVDVCEDKKGKVVDVVSEGYLLNDKIIRFAKVVVGK